MVCWYTKCINHQRKYITKYTIRPTIRALTGAHIRYRKNSLKLNE